MLTRATITILAALALSPATAVFAQEQPELQLPIACELGTNCWIQQYFDHDASGDVRDYACGSQTYDGHDGTDIRVRDTAQTVDVLAAAAGRVKAVRDGEADRLVRSPADRSAVTDRECGNGVLVSHAGGWETQYCHMRQGSVAVKAGDEVSAGQRLGQVGYSGLAAFPHVHLSVRRGAEEIDPFRTEAADQCGEVSRPLWTPQALAALDYEESGTIIRSGFAPGAVELEALETGTQPDDAPSSAWPALVSYFWAINLAAGDTIVVSVEGPQGFAARNEATLDRAKAQYMLFAGRKRPPEGWPPGTYTGRVEVRNGGKVKLSQEWRAALQ